MLYAGSAREGWKAAAEAVLTMWPPWPRSAICLPKNRQPWMTPHRLTSRVFHSSAEVSGRSRRDRCPRRPARRRCVLGGDPAASFIAASSLTSTASPQAAGAPISRAISAVRAAPSASRSTATIPPASANANAVARPIPEAAPVTRTSRPPKRCAYGPCGTGCWGTPSPPTDSFASTKSLIHEDSWSGRVRPAPSAWPGAIGVPAWEPSSPARRRGARRGVPVGVISWTGAWAYASGRGLLSRARTLSR
ncbi:hypothetical protein SCALM49S_04745 [Streptomyces californicus]